MIFGKSFDAGMCFFGLSGKSHILLSYGKVMGVIFVGKIDKACFFEGIFAKTVFPQHVRNINIKNKLKLSCSIND